MHAFLLHNHATLVCSITTPMLGPTLETPRLILRPPIRDDFEAFVAFMADERTGKYLAGLQPRAATWRQFAAIVGAWSLNGFSMFSILEKSTGHWIGRVGPWMPEGWPGAEVGWGIAASAQRRGYAKEAASAAIDWVFDALGWTEVIHCIVPENTASIATAHSLGSSLMRTRVPAPPPFEMCWDIYGQTREQWLDRRG